MPPGGGSDGPDVRQFIHEDELADLYGWLDDIPLSRPKRNITRDFADGVMAAEVIAHFLPRLIETHNYQPCAGRVQKKGNWDTLNKKVLKRFPKMHIPENVIDAIIVMRPGVVEVVLIHLRRAIENYMSHGSKHPRDRDERDRAMEAYSTGGPDKARVSGVEAQGGPAERRDVRQSMGSPAGRRRGRRGDAVTLSDGPSDGRDDGKLGQERRPKLPPIQ